MTYQPPLSDIRYTLRAIGRLEELADLPGCAHATPDVVDAVLEEAGKLAAQVLAPLNRPADVEGSRLENGVVRTPRGFPEAYRAFADGGWMGLVCGEDHGGQGLPTVVGNAVAELWHAANMSFGLCPMLTQSAIELLERHGTAEQQAVYLPRLTEGRWTGTMCLTEPQAGSDVGAVRTRAARDADGNWRVTGQKIYITYGEHDLAENIVHLVLARTPDAPAGTRGLSLFLVPKFLPDAEGRPGARNDVRCVSLEHKLGIRSSPTCVMSFGDHDGAIGWLVGDEQAGMKGMFTMMNNARIGVGVEGLAIAERAYQQALAYARERVQGKGPDGPVRIVAYPDVQRMLLTMKAQIEAMRALVLFASLSHDQAQRTGDAQARGRADLLTPVVKAWCTDLGVEIASLGVQVHGGMGFIEETGAAQHYRDARIAPIYEGTNGIQAMDLAVRKLSIEDGCLPWDLIDAFREDVAHVTEAGEEALAEGLDAGLDSLETATRWLQKEQEGDPLARAAGASPYLRLFGYVTGAMLLSRAALAGRSFDPAQAEAKLRTARFFTAQLLPPAAALLPAITGGSAILAEAALGPD
ncbi:acyl-CoA dehydrogenase [Marinivivus vitaminiproducens]|uniref:acyl-CoA dehydrogenase n=1 Tax=Marinivivus vitaminiproducens TaxID=3035935 RepID=UPI0027A4AD8C|nr:acyl-CoA dehydrogenase [Geminicoccaceae bacterium SCSIO 64248]